MEYEKEFTDKVLLAVRSLTVQELVDLGVKVDIDLGEFSLGVSEDGKILIEKGGTARWKTKESLPLKESGKQITNMRYIRRITKRYIRDPLYRLRRYYEERLFDFFLKKYSPRVHFHKDLLYYTVFISFNGYNRPQFIHFPLREESVIVEDSVPLTNPFIK